MQGEFKTIIKRTYENLKESVYFGEGYDKTSENLITKFLKEGYTIYDQYEKSFDGFKETNIIMLKQNENKHQTEKQILND